mmetsp:Transcript_50378/g.87937  ORF Transcript_50378/g.87937 Transcript_50378/m.87937 type:complete len:192 (-) Transcript_50378:102-677(-)
MYKKNQGHGICGSKNLYSSNVKLGNWVEDKVGLQLTQQEQPVYKNYMSNTNLSYQDPKDQPPLPSMPVNMPTTQELKAKNKEGMQYSLIFDHGLKEIPPEERLVTTNMLTIMKRRNDKGDIASEKQLMRARSKKMIQDFKETYSMTTEARYANAHLAFRPDIAPKPMTGRMDPLPKWHRTGALTSTIPGFH